MRIGTSRIITHEKTNDHTGLIITAIAIIGLIVILANLNYDSIIIIILLVIIVLVLIIGFWGNSVYEKMNRNRMKRKLDKLAQSHFIEFKRLVLNFEQFAEPSNNNILSVIDRIKNNTSEFYQINVLDISIIKKWYQHYKEHLNQFDGTKNGLFALNGEFEDIIFAYEYYYINESIKAMKQIGLDRVRKEDKEAYKIAREDYVDFIRRCKDFANDSNEDFKDTIKLFGSGFRIIEEI